MHCELIEQRQNTEKIELLYEEKIKIREEEEEEEKKSPEWKQTRGEQFKRIFGYQVDNTNEQSG